MSPADKGAEGARAALLAGVMCFVIWGLAPLAYQPMGRAGADAWEIMAHRTLWSVILAGVLVLLAKQGAQVRRVFRDARLLGWLAASTVLIAVNWVVFVWAVNNGHTLETSLGYYLNPLLNMALGVWLFRERLGGFGKAAIALAAVGVALQALAIGQLPWVSLVLAFSFAGYGVIRKRAAVDAQAGLLVECLLMAPFGVAWLIWLEMHGQGHFTAAPQVVALLALAGPLTVFPLALFSWAARRMPLSAMGFLQFIAPTISFCIGVAQGEPFNALRGVSFAFIWAGAVTFAAGAFIRNRASRKAAERTRVV
ncbi:EamA family transporter RarD [Brevundimonas sp. 2R-24]|uniref:EamA family transporter RarD n=1 Tax=Peiella sedimenti TaxID=3061083 RepID=A0ABT8SNQ1_9CAUL|nr:EamA family transporter RarD [Caulobacteraceae bacterium XZ-24]